MSSACLKTVTTSYNQTRRYRGVWQKAPDLRRLKNVRVMSSRRRSIHDVLKTTNLRCIKDVRFTSSSRRLTYTDLKTSDLRCPKDVWFTTSWRRLIYNVLKTSVKRRLYSSVVVSTLIQCRKKWFFLILYCLKYSENFKCFCLG